MRRTLFIAGMVALLLIAGLAGEAKAQGVTIVTVVVPDWTQGKAISYTDPTGTITVSGIPLFASSLNPLETYTWSLNSGSLPPGLTLGSVSYPILGNTPAVVGTPTSAGSYTFTLKAVGSTSGSATQSYTVRISAPPSVVETSLPDAREGVDYSGSLTTTGGTGAVGLMIVPGMGSLPPGLVLNPLTNEIAGRPTARGDYTFTVRATDLVLATADRVLSIKVLSKVSLATTHEGRGPVGESFSMTVTASGGTAPFAFDDPTGLPPGLDWRIDGGTRIIVSGTPTTVGRYAASFRVEDAAADTDVLDIEIVIHEPIALTGGDIGFAVLGIEYATDLALVGGTEPFTATTSSGDLPGGLAFSGPRITGTPTEAGHFVFTVRIEDSLGGVASADFELTVARRLPVNTKIAKTSIAGKGRAAFAFDMVAGTEFTVKLRVKAGGDRIETRMMTTGATAIDLVPHTKVGKKSVNVKKVPIPETGRAFLVITNPGDLVVPVSGKVRGRPSRGFARKVTLDPAGSEMRFPFAALKGAKLTVVAKVAGKDAPAAELVELTGPSGSPEDTGPFTKPTKSGFKISKLPASAGGDLVLELRPSGSGSAPGTMKLTLKIKSPKGYLFTAE